MYRDIKPASQRLSTGGGDRDLGRGTTRPWTSEDEYLQLTRKECRSRILLEGVYIQKPLDY